MTDQEPLALAIKTALAAAMPTGAAAYDTDEIPGADALPGSVPQRFVVFQIMRQFEDTRRFGGAVMVPTFRLDTTVRADNVTSCRELRRRVSAALEGVILPGDIGPFTFNDETQPIDRDYLLGGWSGVDTWTF